ncbi:MAG: GPR endopeptidase [Syntrophomonadaceae bacterium]|nr:GPR endopeptidase [Syntrophomonadaceae bacterium]
MNELLRHFSLQVDLAMEARDLVRGDSDLEIPGVIEEIEELRNGKITIIRITDSAAEKRMGKPIGTYVTIEAKNLRIRDPEVHEEVSQAIAGKLKNAVDKIDPKAPVLLVGLGNWRATPDSLGPKTIESSPVTRHYYKYAPQALVEGMRPVCAISPGVLGTTGIETFEIIKGIVEKIKPALVLVIDSLSAQNTERIGSTIQISDTGIQPGSALSSVNRQVINHESLGVPVIAIGCPMVVNAVTIADQAVQAFCQKRNLPYDRQESVETIKPVLSFFGGSLTVTPKEVDDLVENVSNVISYGIAYSLFPEISREQLELYAH